MSEQKKRVLIIDSNNAYIRAYVVDPSISTKGEPIGGIKGYLKILQKLCRLTKPDRIVICWDGAGGSTKRKQMAEGYKDGRKPLRLNRNVDNLTENDNVRNQVWQMTRLIDYLNDLPVVQLMFDGTEADDLISHVAQHDSLKDYNKIIASNDKDFYQLCAKDVVLFRPVKEQFESTTTLLKEHGIHPKIFAMARAVAADSPDILPGIVGVGLKTLVKRVPLFAEDRGLTIDEMINFCAANNNKKIKAFQNIIDGKKLIQKNYSVMQLYVPQINPTNAQKIQYAFDNSECTFEKLEFTKKCIQDGFGEFNGEVLFAHMNHIVNENCVEKD